MNRIGRGMNDQMIGARDLRQTAKHAAEQRSEMPCICAWLGLFKKMTVLSPHQPYLKRHARSIRTKSDVIALRINDTPTLFFLLPQNVAENASLFFFEPGHRGAKLIENPAGNEGGCRHLRM